MPHKQIPLYGNQGIYQILNAIQSDSGIADYPYFLNGYFEKTEYDQPSRQWAYVKRPGLGTVLTQGFTNNHRIQGIVGSTDRTKLMIYSNSGAAARAWYWDGTTLTDRGVPPAAAGNWTQTGPVAFTVLDGASYGAGNAYAVTDFTKGALLTSVGVWTEITDVDFTGLTKVTNFEALDGYLFIGTSNNRIYNCDLNTPSAWIATSFLNAADVPGNLMWLKRIRNYLVAFKDRSIEFFEDVGNPTPGSPLEPRKQLNRTIGCINKSSIQELSDSIVFAGAGSGQAPRMYKIDKNSLQITEFSNSYINRCLTQGFNSNYQPDSVVAGTGTQLNGGQSQVVAIAGKEFYTITLLDPNSASGKKYTHVYDNQLGIWTTWTSSLLIAGTNDSYGFVGSQATVHNGSDANSVIFVDNQNSGAASAPRLLIMTSNVNLFTDIGTNYRFGWTSDVVDFGSRKKKFMGTFELLYDIRSDGTPDPASTKTVTLYYRDYDYNRASGFVATRSLSVDTNSGTRAKIARLGSFRRRNFTLDYLNSTPMRFWGIEVDIEQGETET